MDATSTRDRVFVCVNKFGEAVIRGADGTRVVVARRPGESNQALGARAQHIARQRYPNIRIDYISFEAFRDIVSELELEI